MLHSRSTPRARHSALRREAQGPSVCVVDPQASDFADWQPELICRGVQFHQVGSAEEALRLARREAIDLWVVNTDLSGLSGCELCGMLRAAGHTTPVYLLAENYSAELEQAAWRAAQRCLAASPHSARGSTIG